MKEQKWLIDRIWDIMHSKKSSIERLVPLAGMKYTSELQRYLDGSVYISPEILQDIANGLGVTVERLEQTDYEHVRNRVSEALKVGKSADDTINDGVFLVDISVGTKERAWALRDLGWLHYHRNDFESAKKEWEKACKLASSKSKRKTERYVDENLFFKLVCDLTTYRIDCREYESALEYLDKNQTNFIGDAEKIGMIHQNRGLCLLKLGRTEEARDHYVIALESFKITGNPAKVCRVLSNLAEMDYLNDEYDSAKEMLVEAAEYAKHDTLFARCVIDLNLARTLIMLGENERAEELIDSWVIHRRGILDGIREETRGKFLLLKTDLSKDPKYAETAMTFTKISRQLRCCCADILATIYMEIREDAITGFKYYRIVKENTISGVEEYKKGDWF